MSNHHHYGGSSIEDGGGRLHHRRTGSKSSTSKLPRPQLIQHKVSYSKTKDHHDGGISSFLPWLSRQNKKLLYMVKRLKKLKGAHLSIIAVLTILIITTLRIATSSGSTNLSMHCSPILRKFKHKDRKSESNIILMASHLRNGPDGEMRLRIIEHNLQLLAEQEKEEEQLLRGEVTEEQNNDKYDSSNSISHSSKSKPLKAVLLFSIDTRSSQSDVQKMINEWRQQIPDTHLAYNIISQIIYVPNDPTMVDASKWIVAIEQLLPEIQYTNARVMLINDSFVLTRNVPELWPDDCGDVCGLVWTAPENDESKHIQSYIRTLSSCAVERYRNFYYQKKSNIRNVHELIVEFELNLSWVGGVVSAIYDFAGAHPDDEEAQKALIPKGYPAIKLKKFFVTDDPWLSEPETTRSRLPPSFSATIYKRMNHDLNYLSDEDAEKHFAEDGKNEDRIYSTLPLVIKDWLRAELVKMGNEETTIAILEAYLAALNQVIVNTAIEK